jgi:maltose O-acetyltransferase
MTTEKQKMIAGELYSAADPELQRDHAAAQAWMAAYNAPAVATAEQRHARLAAGLGRVGRGVVVRPPFHIDYGYNIDLADGVFLNFGCVVLDGTLVAIGEATQIGPGVQILTADHPRDPVQRRAGLEFSRPVRIGANVWIGGGALVLPGVSIGDDAVIGAGAVVTRDVPAGATAVGNPARAR